MESALHALYQRQSAPMYRINSRSQNIKSIVVAVGNRNTVEEKEMQKKHIVFLQCKGKAEHVVGAWPGNQGEGCSRCNGKHFSSQTPGLI